MHKKNLALDISAFTLENVKDKPMQSNGTDCGVFVLKYAEYLSRNAAFNFESKDIKKFRKIMMYEIMNSRIIYKKSMEGDIPETR